MESNAEKHPNSKNFFKFLVNSVLYNGFQWIQKGARALGTNTLKWEYRHVEEKRYPGNFRVED